MVTPKATVTKNTFWIKAKQHKCFYFTDGTSNSADSERNPTGCSSLPSLSPPYIYTSASVCAQNSKVSVLTKYSKGFHRRGIYPLSNISLPILRTEKIQPGLGTREGMRKHVPAHGFATNLWYVFGQALLCSFFFLSHALSSLFLFQDPQGGDSFCLWLLSLKTACTVPVQFNAASVSQKMLERQHTPSYFLHFTELNIKLSMKWRYTWRREKYGQG